MTLLGEAVLKITTDDSDVDRAFKDTKSKADAAGGAIKTALATAGGFVIAQGLLKLPGLIGDITGAASDMNESVSKAKTVFGDQFSEIEQFAAGAAKGMGMSNQQALEATGTFGNFLQAMGAIPEEAADMSQGMVKLAADLGSFNNANPEEVLLALRSGLSGEAEPMRRFGVALSETAVKAKAAEMGLKPIGGVLTEQQKIAARYAIIMEQTAMAQGDFARTSDGLANRQKILKAQFADLQTEAGQKLLPVFVAIAGFLVNNLIPAIGSVASIISTALAPAFTIITDVIKGVIAGFQEADVTSDGFFGKGEAIGKMLREDLVPAVQSVIEVLKGFIPTLLEIGENLIKWYTGLAQVALQVITFAAEIGVFSAALEGARVIITVIVEAIKFFTDVLTSNQLIMYAVAAALAVVLVAMFPIPAAIMAIIVAVGYLSNNWDAIRAKTFEVWNAIPGPIRAALDFILQHVTTIIGGVINIFEGWITVVKNVIGLFVNIVQGDWAGAWNNLKGIAEGALQILKGLVEAGFGAIPGLIRSAISGAVGAATDLGSSIIDAVGDGISNAANGAINKARDVANQIIDAIKSTLRNFSISGTVGGVNLGPLGTTPSVSFNLKPFAFLARGTPFFGGGLAMLGELGPELVQLPRGTKVHDNAKTRRMSDNGFNSAGGFGGLNVAHMTVYANDEGKAKLAAANVLYTFGTAARARGMINA